MRSQQRSDPFIFFPVPRGGKLLRNDFIPNTFMFHMRRGIKYVIGNLSSLEIKTILNPDHITTEFLDEYFDIENIIASIIPVEHEKGLYTFKIIFKTIDYTPLFQEKVVKLIIDLVNKNIKESERELELNKIINSIDEGLHLNFEQPLEPINQFSFLLEGAERLEDNQCKLSIWDGESNSLTRIISKWFLIDDSMYLKLPEITGDKSMLPEKWFFNIARFDGMIEFVGNDDWVFDQFQIPYNYDTTQEIDLIPIIDELSDKHNPRSLYE